MAKRNWTRDETLLAFRLYMRTPFGRLHTRNPEIIELARLIGRTPDAVGMKACNFASLDPMHHARGVVGLRNRSQLEEVIWAEFGENSEAIAAETEGAYARLLKTPSAPGGAPTIPDIPAGPTETSRVIRARRVQGFFRRAVLVSYGGRCAITGLRVRELLAASHIIPWSDSVERRADPTNGICLNALHDRAFDRGLITISESSRVIVSKRLREEGVCGRLVEALVQLEGAEVRLPERFAPDGEALRRHRERVFLDS